MTSMASTSYGIQFGKKSVKNQRFIPKNKQKNFFAEKKPAEIDLRHWEAVLLVSQPIARLTFLRAIKITTASAIVIRTVTAFQTFAIWPASEKETKEKPLKFPIANICLDVSSNVIHLHRILNRCDCYRYCEKTPV